MAVYWASSRINIHASYNHLMSARTPSGVDYREVEMFIPCLLYLAHKCAL